MKTSLRIIGFASIFVLVFLPFTQAGDIVKPVGSFLQISKTCRTYPTNYGPDTREANNLLLRKDCILSINTVKDTFRVLPEGKELWSVYVITTEMRDEGYNSVSKHYEFSFETYKEALSFAEHLARLSAK